MREGLIENIIALEWEMFSTVANAGGPAPCQMDPATFEIMRRSQAGTWPETLLESWLADLTDARRKGRNLMTEKYARMMESTFPEEYRKIADQLPPVDENTRALIEDIVAINLEWKDELAERYPALSGNGRPLRTHEDSPYATSFETYLRGELMTYSFHSIRMLHMYTRAQKNYGINSAAEALLNQAKHYGYASLTQAEAGSRR